MKRSRFLATMNYRDWFGKDGLELREKPRDQSPG